MPVTELQAYLQITMKTQFVLLLFLIIGCSSKKEKLIQSISLKEYDISNLGISSDLPFPHIPKDDKLIIYSEFNKAFYEMELNSGKSKELHAFKETDIVNINGFECFNIINKQIIIYENKSIILIKNNEIEKIKLDDLIAINYPNLRLNEFQIVQNNEFGITNHNSNKFLFVLEDLDDGNLTYVAEFIPQNSKELYIYLKIDPLKSKEQKISLKSKGMFLFNQTTPFITSLEKTLIISNNYNNEFLTLYLDNETIKKQKPESLLFSSGKIKQNLMKEDISEFMKIMKEWNNDISFGPLMPLTKSNRFFRIIKGKSSNLKPFDGPLFIELFDDKFNKIGEEEIPNEQNGFSLEYFSANDKIFIKLISSDENILKYYSIELN